MKKFYQLLASVSLSLMVTGAFAQTPANSKSNVVAKAVTSTTRFANVPHSNTKNVTSTPSNVLLDNLAGDMALNPAGTFFSWKPVLALNAGYTIADTGKVNNMLSNSASVAFDTAYDLYSSGFVSPIPAGMVTVDTILAAIQYHNTSGDNDTIIFNITAVDANGYPAATLYGADTAVITPAFFAYNKLDSIQYLQIIKLTAIPSSARHGYNFAITMTVKTAKADILKDTIAPVYYSQGTSNCVALGGDYTPAATSIGVNDKAQRNVNSFATGLYYNNSKGQHGNNTSMMWPLTSGANQGYCINAGGYYSSPLPLALVGFPSCAGDTNWWDVQDIGIFPSIRIGVFTGVSELANSGFDVAQNAPNPFNRNSQINYSLSKESDVMFSVYDLTGRKLVESNYSNVASGQHVINLSANQFTPGVYFYSVKVNGNVVTKRMVITQ